MDERTLRGIYLGGFEVVGKEILRGEWGFDGAAITVRGGSSDHVAGVTSSSHYPEMVQLLLDIQKKWDIGVIDLFNNADMTAIYDTELYHAYMSDEVHPRKKGYIEWWGPAMDEEIVQYMQGR